MKIEVIKKILLTTIVAFLALGSFAQKTASCDQFTAFNKSSTPDLAIVIYSNDAETTWNALRLATYAQAQGDTVVLFLFGKGLDGFQSKDSSYVLEPFKDTFVGNGGQIIACATCAKQRETDEIGMCTIASMADLYAIIHRSKKVISF